MAIKINWQDLLKRFINWQEIVRVYKNGGQIRPETVPPVWWDYLCFTAQESNSSVTLNKEWNPTVVSLEISYDKSTWMDYNIWGTIALSNVGDKVYMRNKSEIPTGFSNNSYSYFYFSMTWKIWASWDIDYLLCKYSTNTLSETCFAWLFSECTALVSAPSLPATTLASRCYQWMFSKSSITLPPSLPATTLSHDCYEYMFNKCEDLIALPSLPATELPSYCYFGMFSWCTKIKIYWTQTWDHQTPYRIPTSWTGTLWENATGDMFYNTWWQSIRTPSINHTYYTSNQVI